jgi:hypothetical protein
MPGTPEHAPFLKRFETRRQAQVPEHRNLKESSKILESPFESLFKIEEVYLPPPRPGSLNRRLDFVENPPRLTCLAT